MEATERMSGKPAQLLSSKTQACFTNGGSSSSASGRWQQHRNQALLCPVRNTTLAASRQEGPSHCSLVACGTQGTHAKACAHLFFLWFDGRTFSGPRPCSFQYFLGCGRQTGAGVHEPTRAGCPRALFGHLFDALPNCCQVLFDSCCQ